MTKVIKTKNNLTVTVVTGSDIDATISANDKEMDIRAKEAVEAALRKARICGKPIAKYDTNTQRAYLETAAGEKIYVR